MRSPSIITLLEKIGSNRLPRRNSLIPQIILPAAKHVTSINNLQSAKWKQQKKELDYSAVVTSWRKERTRLDTTANEEKTTRLDPSCIKRLCLWLSNRNPSLLIPFLYSPPAFLSISGYICAYQVQWQLQHHKTIRTLRAHYVSLDRYTRMRQKWRKTRRTCSSDRWSK